MRSPWHSPHSTALLQRTHEHLQGLSGLKGTRPELEAAGDEVALGVRCVGRSWRKRGAGGSDWRTGGKRFKEWAGPGREEEWEGLFGSA